MSFGEPRPDWQTVLPLRQGLLIPNGWETPVGRLPFDGRFGTAEDCGNVIAFLASEPGGYVTGANVDIMGGYIA